LKITAKYYHGACSKSRCRDCRICPERGDFANLRLTLKTKLAISIALLAAALATSPGQSGAAGGADAKLGIYVECHCSDPVGDDFCGAVKDKVKDSTAYRLVEHPDSYGIGVHLFCIDMFSKLPTVDSKLSGTMSAVSVAFTIYAVDRLPGEVYDDSSVFRVGKDATDDMAQSLLTAVGQIATANKPVFEKIRAAEKAEKPVPTATPKIIQ
jgi:hypothetical protein